MLQTGLQFGVISTGLPEYSFIAVDFVAEVADLAAMPKCSQISRFVKPKNLKAWMKIHMS
jgi:hypothetical protein